MPDPPAEPGLSERLGFLPVEIVEMLKPRSAAPVAENLIEIDLARGHRMGISGGYDPKALARLIPGLTA